MTSFRSHHLRLVLCAAWMLLLTLGGVGKGFAAASAVGPAGLGIPGVATPICHAGGDADKAPGEPLRHECCDACALSAPATLAEAPNLSLPASVVLFAPHARAMTWAPTLARWRDPRQSRGPPIA